MVSRLLRRSGISFHVLAEFLEWKPDVMYQVGVGMYHQEIDVFKEVWPDLRFRAVEPNRRIYDAVVKKYPGQLLNFALSNYVGQGTLYTRPRHKDGSSLYNHDANEDGEFTTQQIDVTTIDQLWLPEPEGDHILLWLDCEGSELAVLEGSVNFLPHVEVINVEMTSKGRSPGWCSPVEVHNFLKENGFLRQWVHTQRANIGQVDAIYVRPELFDPSFCCCPCVVESYECDKKSAT